VVFVLTNRVFSPQFLVPIAVSWLLAGALLCRTRVQQLALGAAVLMATSANALVFPARIGSWLADSAAFFAVALATTAWLLVAATRSQAQVPDDATVRRVTR
jgi:hypothetical protein